MISIGCDRETACKYLGWSPSQLRNALEQDATFSKQLARAEATPEFNHMRNLHNAAKDEKHWRASVWWLERRAPERYARRSPGAISEIELRHVIEKLAEVIAEEVSSPNDRRRVLERLAQVPKDIQYEQLPELGAHTQQSDAQAHDE